MIETILYCLPSAFKGTIYRIGKPPALIAKRITSGKINQERNSISWGLPYRSEYNPPGKPWVDYRDEPGRPLEAMAWCVEKQKSWTAEDPATDIRSLRLQVAGEPEDFSHMEPVLVHRSNLNLNDYHLSDNPRDYRGNVIWKDVDYVVVAVIKIHFNPYTVRIGSDESRVIKRLSRALGTELLSYQLRQDSLDAMQQMAQDRINACDILADSLRNAITKSGLIISLIKQELGHLREEWEQVLLKERHEENVKVEAVQALNDILSDVDGDRNDLRKDLVEVQNRFLRLSLPPQKGEQWVVRQIEERWREFLYNNPLDEETAGTAWEMIDTLKKSLHYGHDLKVVSGYGKMPEDLKWQWVDLIYGNNDRFDPAALEKVLYVLNDPALPIPSKERSRKTLTQLKALAETMHQLEGNTNYLLRQVLNGGQNGQVKAYVNNRSTF